MDGRSKMGCWKHRTHYSHGDRKTTLRMEGWRPAFKSQVDDSFNKYIWDICYVSWARCWGHSAEYHCISVSIFALLWGSTARFHMCWRLIAHYLFLFNPHTNCEADILISRHQDEFKETQQVRRDLFKITNNYREEAQVAPIFYILLQISLKDATTEVLWSRFQPVKENSFQLDEGITN